MDKSMVNENSRGLAIAEGPHDVINQLNFCQPLCSCTLCITGLENDYNIQIKLNLKIQDFWKLQNLMGHMSHAISGL